MSCTTRLCLCSETRCCFGLVWSQAITVTTSNAVWYQGMAPILKAKLSSSNERTSFEKLGRCSRIPLQRARIILSMVTLKAYLKVNKIISKSEKCYLWHIRIPIYVPDVVSGQACKKIYKMLKTTIKGNIC